MGDSGIFRNRVEAGRLLAERLSALRGQSLSQPLQVIALPRGGVPVAAEIARRLAAPLTVMGVRKIAPPASPEFGIGAIAEEGFFWIDPEGARKYGLTSRQLNEILAARQIEVGEDVRRFRGGRRLPDLSDSTILLVDDGLATGVTAVVAAQYLRSKGAKSLVLAVPVCSRDGAEMARHQFDEVICLRTPERFWSVGLWYEDFEPVTADQVESLLAEANLRIDGREVLIPAGKVRMPGTLRLPEAPRGIVIFAHGSGSSRRSRRNQAVADRLVRKGWATLLFDLLDDHEAADPGKVFNIRLLAERLEAAVQWSSRSPETRSLAVALYGASTGAAAALRCPSLHPGQVFSIVSRGGRPDLALQELAGVHVPVLLLVGSRDPAVLALNLHALPLLSGGELKVIPGATHLFGEPGAMEQVIEHTIRGLDRAFAMIVGRRHAA